MGSTDEGDAGRVAGWMARLADDSGEVGGGAACAVMAATAAALVEMVARYSNAQRAGRDAASARRAALAAASSDGEVSAALGAALREGGDDGIRRAALESAHSSLEVGELAAGLGDELEPLVTEAAGYLVPDVVVAIEAATAAVAGAQAIAVADLRLARSHSGAGHDGIDDLDRRMRTLEAARDRLGRLREAASARL